jgi:xylan 1,4-beta-xylosidase
MKRRDFLKAAGLAAGALGLDIPGKADEPGGVERAVAIRVRADRPGGELPPIWRFFGADEPNYAYLKDGQQLLTELGHLGPAQTYFRTHNLLTSGDGTPALKWGSTGVYAEDAQGKPVYDWTIVDRIFDTYRERKVKPYVQIGFMPRELSVKPEPYQHQWTPGAKYDAIFTGWAYPPKDYGQWAELVHQWVRHCLEKYGRREVESWYWEVWNEPNIGYWRGTPEEFHKLHDHAIHAVRRALPTAKVGGPDSAGGGRFLKDFLEHCLRGTNHATGEKGTPLDFLSFHAKGAPTFVNGHVRMGIANHLRAIDSAFALIASFPELKGKPIVIGESDPDGCAACPAKVYPANGYRNGALYASYTAASFARKYDLADKHGVRLEGALTWAFEFEDQPFFAGFRVLASNGLALPVLNVFRMFGQMTGRRLTVDSDGAVALETILKSGVRDQADVSALGSLAEKKLCVLVWHYHDEDVSGPAAAVELTVQGLDTSGQPVTLTHDRIDGEHSNAYTAWQRMDSPGEPSAEQRAILLKASALTRLEDPKQVEVRDGRLVLRFTLPRQSVSLVRLEW